MIDLIDATEYSIEQLATVIRTELANAEYNRSDNLRTAVMYCPLVMTRAEFIAAAKVVGIHSGTAGNRFREVRMFQRELGEVA